MKCLKLDLLPQEVNDPGEAAGLDLVDVEAPEAEVSSEQFGTHVRRSVQLAVLNVVDNGREHDGVPLEEQLVLNLFRVVGRQR